MPLSTVPTSPSCHGTEKKRGGGTGEYVFERDTAFILSSQYIMCFFRKALLTHVYVCVSSHPPADMVAVTVEREKERRAN